MTPYLQECVRNFTNIKLMKEINVAEKYSNDEFYRILIVILPMKLSDIGVIETIIQNLNTDKASPFSGISAVYIKCLKNSKAIGICKLAAMKLVLG